MRLETEIRNIINETINGKYIGKLKVQKEDFDDGTVLWALFLYLDMEMSPVIMAYQGSEDEFKEFIRKEIKSRKLEMVSFWRAELEYADVKIDEEDNDDDCE